MTHDTAFQLILGQAKQGDKSARTQLINMLEPYREQLLRKAERELNPEVKKRVGASDVVQDLFRALLQDLPNVQGDTLEQLVAWMKTAMRHRLLNVHRDQGRRGVHGEQRLDE